MADAYRQAGASRDAMLAYEQFLSFFPDSEFRAMVHFRLGSLRFEEEDYLRAAIDFTSVLDSEAPEEISAAALFNLALCKRILGESEEALATLEQYRQRYPEGDERAVDVAYHMGDILENAGRKEEAIEEYKKALNAKPPGPLSIELWYRIGLCREQIGSTDRAIKAYRRAMAAKDKDDVYRLLAVARCAGLYEDKEDYVKALSTYRDLIRNSDDEELVLAAKERASQLEAMLE
jgi:TolA-binding protein